MKQRFSSLDIKIIAHELSNTLTTLRLSNIYDLSSRIFLLKFAKPDHREQLLIDSGFRCHLTAFSRGTAAAPSPFVARLRKFIRTRRVTSVRQVGTDRVIEIVFSEGLYRLFLEFYAGGNVILCDAELNILTLLRNVNEGEEHERYRQGLKYNLHLRQNFDGVPELTEERVRVGLQKAQERQALEAKKPGKKRKGGDALRKALATTTEFPPVLLDHVLEGGGFGRESTVDEVLGDEAVLGRLMGCLREAGEVVREIMSKDVAKGYILARRKDGAKQETKEVEGEEEEEDERKGLMYEDFHPFRPKQLAEDPGVVVLEYEGFNKAVDEFFSSIEGQRLESKLQEREDTARKKIEAARQEQDKRIDGLQQVQELNVRKAQAIQANVPRVEEAVNAVNGLIAQGMDWVDIGHLIESEQSRQNAVAMTIKLPLKLHENTITLLLSENDDADASDDDMADKTDSEASDSEDEAPSERAQPAATVTDRRLTIDIDLALSPWANARQYHDQRRTAAQKQERTALASHKALKNTEQRVMADLKKGLKQEKDVLRPVRKQLWFEKFIYFISSDNYLVLAGKDAQQNEILYRRYLKKGDVYVHADLHGAASVIIKNNPATPDAPIPPSTLSQAGSMAVCTSSAWDSKAAMSAWWVNWDQVSKTAPTGEYLATGGFMVRGKKNFLPPSQLLLGFAVMFCISEESKARHVKHRLGNGAGPAADVVKEDGGEDVASVNATEAAHETDDEDDEFPDAVLDDAKNEQTEADEDDDFEDVRQAGSGDDDDHRVEARSNPLQNGHHTDAANDDDASGSEDDGEADFDPSAAAETRGEDDEPEEEPTDIEAAQTGGQKRQSKKDQPVAISQSNKPAQQKRGKRAKAKKQAAKYANQDEEDRALAMQLLGSKAADEKSTAEAAEAAQKESLEEARARRRAQHEKAQKQGLEAEEIRRLNLEEGVEALDEDEASQLTSLDSYVGASLPGDEIIDIIPVCAPWAALAKHKYKVKMQPGQTKKGKAVREMLGAWVKASKDKRALDEKSEDKEKIWPREAELLQGLKETEVVGVVPVKMVRVVLSHAEKGKGGAAARGGKGGGRGGKGSKKK
ncbi:hypothetical protein B0A48_03357 [Cryoendolithus antarcticus]|uniref:Ribosome quality control complex subunit 2 n=1 Tax=Cryoendolithus antarcticus TaxID=1507870 RepID=A0A1V8TJS6_9PEZI|nr:hypothetical protein B0A48_03357 [Cryoendolithus antarcticus]